MKGIWSGIDKRIKADQARSEADWLDGMDWPGLVATTSGAGPAATTKRPTARMVGFDDGRP